MHGGAVTQLGHHAAGSHRFPLNSNALRHYSNCRGPPPVKPGSDQNGLCQLAPSACRACTDQPASQQRRQRRPHAGARWLVGTSLVGSSKMSLHARAHATASCQRMHYAFRIRSHALRTAGLSVHFSLLQVADTHFFACRTRCGPDGRGAHDSSKCKGCRFCARKCNNKSSRCSCWAPAGRGYTERTQHRRRKQRRCSC